MQGIGRDLQFAFRQLGKAPGFALTVVLTLALGIGATTAIFSLVEGILLRPLPFRDPDHLVLLGDHLGSNTGLGVTAREIATYARATSAFSSEGSFIGASYELSGGPTTEEISAARLTSSVFPTLGVQPILGRVFTEKEEDAREPLVVISYALWMNRFHRDPRIVGASIELSRKTYSIIGVMPRSFEFPVDSGRLNQVQLWVPMSLTPDELSDQATGFWGFHIVARIKDEVSLTAAAEDADRVAHEIMRNFPPGMSALHIRGDVEQLREYAVGETRPLLRTLFVCVSIVLLIACVNVAVLLLVRAIRRRREYAVRLALGARPRVILREAVCEGLLFSFAGGLLGLGGAGAALSTILHLLPDSMPRLESISIDATVAGFALLLALVTGALCSVAPAFAAVRTDLIESLKEGVKTGGAKSHAWLRSALVVVEIAVALILLTTSGAFLRSYQKMLAVDPGYHPDHVLVAGYQLPLDQYATDASVDAFNHAVVDRLSSQPGVTAVSLSNMLPGSDTYGMAAYTIEGQPTEDWKLKFAAFGTTYGDYFGSLGMRLLEGRTFSADDRSDAPLVVIVNRAMANHSWPGQRAIGKRMHVGNPKKHLPWATVVGVVADAKMGSRDEKDSDQWFAPAEQPAILYEPEPLGKRANSGGGYITLRSALPPGKMIQTLREVVAGVDPLLALEHVQSMNDVVSDVEAPRRFNTDIISAFAAAALALAITGIYAVVAFSVSLRAQEIAIRMALGSQRTGIARLVLASGAEMAFWGCGIGVLGSLAASRLVTSFLFDVSATDPAIYFTCVLIMMLVALLASALPAIRAASADPMQELRSI
jgi:putative ABC transport system permease protein